MVTLQPIIDNVIFTRYALFWMLWYKESSHVFHSNDQRTSNLSVEISFWHLMEFSKFKSMVHACSVMTVFGLCLWGKKESMKTQQLIRVRDLCSITNLKYHTCVCKQKELIHFSISIQIDDNRNRWKKLH